MGQTSFKWEFSAPENHNLDTNKIHNLYQYIKENKIKVDCVLIVKNKQIIYEKYVEKYLPKDELIYSKKKSWIHENKRHIIYSCTKSVVSLLIGIFLEQLHIKSVQERFFDILPELWKDSYEEKKKKITVEHLLTMTSGIPWDLKKTSTHLEAIFETPLASDPGLKFQYSAGPDLLTVMIQLILKKKVSEFADQVLFTPLDIKKDEWEWEEDNEGFCKGATGLWLTPRAMAKIGLVYLNKGLFNGNQIVSSDWIIKSSTPQVCHKNAVNWDIENKQSEEMCIQDNLLPQRGDCYGYLTWISPEWYAATGFSSQRIYIIDKHDMVIVFTASTHFESGDKHYRKIIKDFILG